MSNLCHEWDGAKAYWCRCAATHRVTASGGGRHRTVVNVKPSANPLYCLKHAIDRALEVSANKGYDLGFNWPAKSQPPAPPERMR